MATAAVNYATALYELSVSKNTVDEARQSFENCPELSQVLSSPVLPFEEKCRAIDKVFAEDIRNFIKVVCKNGRISIIDEIFTEYKRYYNRKNGVLDAQLFYTALPTEKQQEGIKNFLKKKKNVQVVNLTLIHKPELIGGFVIKADGIEFDRSYKGKLNALSRKLVRR